MLKEYKTSKKDVIKYSDFISNYFYQQIAYFITMFLLRTKFTPNQVTIVSLGLGIASAVSVFLNHQIIAIILLNISFILDCVDGQLARAKQLFSPIGTWLDNISDRIVENSIVIAVTFLLEDKYIWSDAILLVFANMFYTYVQDISLLNKIKYRPLFLYEKIIFSPIYFISRSMLIPMLSLLILFPVIAIKILLFLYSVGIIFRIYREITNAI